MKKLSLLILAICSMSIASFGQLKPAQCTPSNASWNSLYGYCIYDFKLTGAPLGTNILNTQFTEHGTFKYEDFTSMGANSVVNNSFQVEVKTGQNGGVNPMTDVFIYLDVNNTGLGLSSSLVFSSLNKNVHTGFINIPCNIVRDVPLRLRVISKQSATGTWNVCNLSYVNGQAEDYFIIVKSAVVLSSSAPFCDPVYLYAYPGGTGATYSWSNGATTPTTAVHASGTYSVTINNAGGCGYNATASITVTVNPIPTPTITSNSPTTFCDGGSVTLVSSAASSYLWSNGATTKSITVDSYGAGDYSVTVTNNGCSGTSLPVTVVVKPVPATTLTLSGSPFFCDGDSVVITANPASSYLWDNGATTQSITMHTTGLYIVTATYPNGCSSSNGGQAAAHPNPAPVVTLSGSPVFCQGGSVTLTSSPDGSYPGHAVSYTWSNGSTSQSMTATTSGTYSVTVTDIQTGCSGTSAPTTVSTNPDPTILASGPTTFCTGDFIKLTSSYAAGGYTWSNGSNTQSILVYSSDKYFVTTTDANNCKGTSAITLVTVSDCKEPMDKAYPSGDMGWGDKKTGKLTHQVISDDVTEANSLVSLYPNPTNGNLMITIDEHVANKAVITIYDILGNTLFTEITYAGTQLEADLSKQPAGIYLVRIQSGLQTINKRLLKN